MADRRKQQLKIRPIWLALGVVLIVAILGVAVYALAGHISAKKKENDASISFSDIKIDNIGKDVIEDNANRVQATVEVQLSDCAVTVGTKFKVTAVVTPADTEQALVWSSNNTGIFEVEQNGVVTVKGAGTAVLTATVGNVSDSVVIEGISRVTDGSANNLPIYNVAQDDVINGGSNSSGGENSGGGSTSSGGGNSSSGGGSTSSGGGSSSSGSGGTSSGSGSASGTGSGSSTGSSGSTGGNESSNSGGGSSNSGESSSESGSTSGGGGSSSGGNGSTSGGGGSSTDTADEKGTDSTKIGEYLPDCGFGKVMTNVYEYRDGGTYLGEIITQPDVTIIYIKQRNEVFDTKIKEVLAKLLPKEHGQVWSNYITAASDRTFTVEERKVRIVVAANGGHSQIVIYN